MRVLQPDGTFPMRVVLRTTSAHEEEATRDGKGGCGLVVSACSGVMRSDVPDLDDPATAGCLLAALVATGAAWNMDTPDADADGCWCVWLFPADGSAVPHDGSTLGRAAAAALLACWGEP